jgi:predicted nucleotidyltransferase
MSIKEQYQNQLVELCKEHHVETLYLFGSAQSGTMTSSSDVDLLVKFKKFNIAKYFQNYIDFKAKLQALFNRNVDLLEEQTLSNPYLIKSINQNKELIYG